MNAHILKYLLHVLPCLRHTSIYGFLIRVTAPSTAVFIQETQLYMHEVASHTFSHVTQKSSNFTQRSFSSLFHSLCLGNCYFFFASVGV